MYDDDFRRIAILKRRQCSLASVNARDAEEKAQVALLQSTFVTTIGLPLQSSRQHLINDDCLEYKREGYQNCSVLCYV